MIVWDYHGGKNQQFSFDKHGHITAEDSDLVLDVEGGIGEGRHIIQWPCKNLNLVKFAF